MKDRAESESTKREEEYVSLAEVILGRHMLWLGLCLPMELFFLAGMARFTIHDPYWCRARSCLCLPACLPFVVVRALLCESSPLSFLILL